jgi:preflagellin peptidase FlaK
VDSSNLITGIRLVAAIAVMSYASLLDWKTRRIGNVYWIALSVLGLALIPIQLGIDDQPMEYLLVLIPILAILSDVYLDAGEGKILSKLAPALKYAAAVIAVVLLGYAWLDETYFQHLLAVPVMMLFIVLMYMLDIVRGGADAKALLALSTLFPFYPAMGSLPVIEANTVSAEILFPFSFVILMTAAIIVAFFPVGFLIKNLSAGEFGFPQGLLGYKMDADSIKGKHVWLMERIEDGKHKVYTRPKTDEDLEKELGVLVEAGKKRIWITPKIPFIIPMLAALVFSTIVGNILLLFFQA